MKGQDTADTYYERLQRALEICLKDIIDEKPTTDEAKLIRECSKQAVRRALSFVDACRYADTPWSTINKFKMAGSAEAADGQRRPADVRVLQQFSRDLGFEEPHLESWPTILAGRLVTSMAINKLPPRETSSVFLRLIDQISTVTGQTITPVARRVALHRARDLVLKSHRQAQPGTL